MGGDIAASRGRRLHEHLAATRERPIERVASRWIGEADAIADDLFGAGEAAYEPAVIGDRVGHIATLLSNVEETGDPVADEHVEAARDLAEAMLESNAE